MAAVLLSGPALSDAYEQNMKTLSEAVQSNPLSEGGYWLEMRNAFGEWERLMLIFGYADPGDEAACQRVIRLTIGDNAAGMYRCDAVR